MTQTTTLWQHELQQAVRDPQVLWQLLALPAELLPQIFPAQQDFALKVPRNFIAKMRIGDLSDPLLQQILPSALEMQVLPGFSKDPLAEKNANKIPGLLHKYCSRVLLTVTGACGIHCRYCFRRHFPYQDNRPSQQDWDAVVAYIAAEPQIQEVIFSGGDPLLAPDTLLAALAEKIASIEHVKSLRIHSRLPVLLPSRIDQTFIQWFTQSRLKPTLVTHINHPQEMDSNFFNAMQTLRQKGVTLLNQSVLLKGINDDVNVLQTLSEILFYQAGILPYYLHLLDKVQGASHFEVSLQSAQALMRDLQTRCAGYLVPRLSQEIAGAMSKKVYGF